MRGKKTRDESARLTTAFEPEPAEHDAATADLAQSGPRVLVVPHVRASRVDQLPHESRKLVVARVFLADRNASAFEGEGQATVVK